VTRAPGKHIVAALLIAWSASPASAERLVASLSSHVVQITSNFNGVELVLFGLVEGDQPNDTLRTKYDLVATTTGPHQTVVTRRKQRMFGIWVNAESRAFVDVPSYVSVVSNRPIDAIADAETLRRQQIGVENVALPAKDGTNQAATDDEFRQALLRLKGERKLYGETPDGVTFLTPTLYRASIFVPAEAQTGNYEVIVKLFADGIMVARTNSAFELDTVGFERFIAFSAVDHGTLYGLATAFMALMTGWFASVVFRRD
jgi:uncharacterized protein (TIGR02186 family)